MSVRTLDGSVWLPRRTWAVIEDTQAPKELRDWATACKPWLRNDLKLSTLTVRFIEPLPGYRAEMQAAKTWGMFDVSDGDSGAILISTDCPVSEVCEVMAHEGKHAQQWARGMAEGTPDARDASAMAYATAAAPVMRKALARLVR